MGLWAMTSRWRLDSERTIVGRSRRSVVKGPMRAMMDEKVHPCSAATDDVDDWCIVMPSKNFSAEAIFSSSEIVTGDAYDFMIDLLCSNSNGLLEPLVIEMVVSLHCWNHINHLGLLNLRLTAMAPKEKKPNLLLRYFMESLLSPLSRGVVAQRWFICYYSILLY